MLERRAEQRRQEVTQRQAVAALRRLTEAETRAQEARAKALKQALAKIIRTAFPNAS
jgi:alpha-L-fucosidase